MKRTAYLISLLSLGVYLITGLVPAAVAQPAEESAEKESAESSEDDSVITPEIHCTVDISYAWEHRQDPAKGKVTGKKKAKKAPEKTKEFYKTTTATAPSAKEATEQLQTQLAELKATAFEVCQKKHSNMANCVAGGIRKNSSEYRLLDFSARRTILKALEEDCRVRSGRCLSASSGSINCSSPTATADPKPAAKETSEEEKK